MKPYRARAVKEPRAVLAEFGTVIPEDQDFTGEPVARVHLPARVPLGFHGSWIADR